MCGLAGLLRLDDAPGAQTPAARRAGVAAMSAALRHRGPDAEGFWEDTDAGIALGHRRLSILDLSAAGAQPMVSACERYVIAYNGEIYGHAALARTLENEGARFKGHSDTEVLLEAIARWGLDTALERINGMFAFAVWDRSRRTLSLARDRAGKKPLYVARTAHGLAFASEMSAVMQAPGFSRSVSGESLALFLRYGAVPAPHTIFADAWQMPPATAITITPDMASGAIGASVSGAKHYWDAAATARAGEAAARRHCPSDLDAIDRIEALLGTAVEERLVADVPVGAFLSGGIDSTSVVALMCERARGRVETYTIGFEEDGYDEAQHARAISRQLGTDHHEMYVSGGQARDVIPHLPEIYSEPFADSSQIPTFLISRFARSRVTVALSGDGGDESFGGYNRHLYGPRLAAFNARWPHAMRRSVATLADALPPHAWDTLLRPFGQPQAGDRLHKLANALRATDEADLFRRFQSVWPAPDRLVRDAHEPAAPALDPRLSSLAAQMMLADFLHYLPTGPLHKVDRASMAVSLEVRCPLLDRRIVEAAWALPPEMKIRDQQGKWVLRELIARRLPRALMERPKQGFGVPVGQWLRGPLRDWAEALLDPARLAEGGLIDPTPVRAAWERHLSGRENRATQLWTVLMFEAWRERWL